MKQLLILFIKSYQFLRSVFGHRDYCMFYPTCSEYFLQCVQKYGVARGVLFGIRRLLRCNPWAERQIDLLK